MGRKWALALVYGWTTILFMTLTAGALLSLIIRYSNIQPSTLSYITLAVGLLTLFVGGFIAGVKGKNKGWVIGLLTGLGFTLLIFFIQYLGYNELFSMKQTVYHGVYLLCAIFGSIIGVNLAGNNQESNG